MNILLYYAVVFSNPKQRTVLELKAEETPKWLCGVCSVEHLNLTWCTKARV